MLTGSVSVGSTAPAPEENAFANKCACGWKADSSVRGSREAWAPVRCGAAAGLRLGPAVLRGERLLSRGLGSAVYEDSLGVGPALLDWTAVVRVADLMVLGDISWKVKLLFCLISLGLLNSCCVEFLVLWGYVTLFLICMFFHPSSATLSTSKPSFLIFFFYLPLPTPLPWIPKHSVLLTGFILFLLWISELLHLKVCIDLFLFLKKGSIEKYFTYYTIHASKVHTQFSF